MVKGLTAARHTAAGCEYRKTTLRNGLRVITERIPSVRSISLGVWIDVGSRNEAPDENGVTHLIEHMLFKGTRRRSAKQIASALESVGGGLNAFTSRENTCLTARIMDENLDVAVDLLADMACNSTVTPTNLKLERKVICEEIQESLETPADHIHDLFATTFWGGHPLGQPILGDRETMQSLPPAKIKEYINRHYRTGSIVIAAAGCVSHQKLVKLVREKFDFPVGDIDRGEAAHRDTGPRTKLVADGNSQTHLCLGFPGLAYGSDDRMAVAVLSAYLGGGMSAVLFQKVREEKGLAYSVYTYHDFFQDAGIFGAYMATDKVHVREAIEITLGELNKLKKRRIPEARLEQVKTQIKGQMALGMESTANHMNRMARHELMFGEFIPFETTLKAIDEIDNSRILELANRLFDQDNITCAILGPADANVFKGIA